MKSVGGKKRSVFGENVFGTGGGGASACPPLTPRTTDDARGETSTTVTVTRRDGDDDDGHHVRPRRQQVNGIRPVPLPSHIPPRDFARSTDRRTPIVLRVICFPGAPDFMNNNRIAGKTTRACGSARRRRRGTRGEESYKVWKTRALLPPTPTAGRQ